jgi:hypothetical protein
MALLATRPPLRPNKLLMAAVHRVRTWPVDSQQTARRNAMLACTSLTQRRVERQDVEDFLVSFYGSSYASRPVRSRRSHLASSRTAPSVAHG